MRRLFDKHFGIRAILTAMCLISFTAGELCYAQVDGLPMPTIGKRVPAEVEQIYKKGLQYLVKKQNEDGAWPTSSGFGSDTAGVTAICTMAFLSSGEDPNFGKFAPNIRRALRKIIRSQNPRTGLFKGNTYDFGFALLVLAEAYGVVDEQMLWEGVEKKSAKTTRTIAKALELAVGAAIMVFDRIRSS